MALSSAGRYLLEDTSFCVGGKRKRLRGNPAEEKPGIGPQPVCI